VNNKTDTPEQGLLTSPDGSTEDLGEIQLKLPCPCGQTVIVYASALLHEMPMCQDFEGRSPVDYVTWLRRQHEKDLEAT